MAKGLFFCAGHVEAGVHARPNVDVLGYMVQIV
jgi:hypothetical protein